MNLNLRTDNTSPFSADGRFGRFTFLAWNLLIGLTIGICFLLLFFLIPNTVRAIFTNTESLGITVVSWAPNLIWFYFYIIFTIKRLHDLNLNGWLSLLNLIPIINIFFGLYLIFSPGTERRNTYGYPRETKAWETVLACIYIILFCFVIVGFITAFGQLSALFF